MKYIISDVKETEKYIIIICEGNREEYLGNLREIGKVCFLVHG